VRFAERVFVVGGGNVGLITAYHALQAGVDVVGLVEVAAECGGYRVHHDKLVRAGVPIHTSHTILSANGEGAVESVTIARVDEAFRPVAGSERSFACDAVLVAVGLDPVDEFTAKARAAGSARRRRRRRGRRRRGVGGDLRRPHPRPRGGADAARLRRHRARGVAPHGRGAALQARRERGALAAWTASSGVHPVFHCAQAIPCNPCASVCPQHLIHVDEDDIRAGADVPR
jgi:sarcosine oxidase, subunit alpha